MSLIGAERTALFWKCGAKPDRIFEKVLLRLQRDNLKLPSGPNLLRKTLDRASGLFVDGQRAGISEWRDGAELVERWDGFAFDLIGAESWGVEFLKADDAAALMLRVSEETWHRQRARSGPAMSWLRLLLEIFERAEPELCVFPLDLGAIPVSRWAAAVAQRLNTAELRLERGPVETAAPSGFKTIRYGNGLVLTTSLPVKDKP